MVTPDIETLIERLERRRQFLDPMDFTFEDARLTGEAIADAIAALRAVRWRPISDAPKDGTPIAVCGRGWASIGSWHTDRWYTRAEWHGSRPLLDGRRSAEPTHWMPLPAARASKEG